ncbi:MAG: carboxypeptidase regulatory-like domain-containing protein, partial [Candidatus Cloacimonetes bacterium]|nr:carboxypeptidase regulatory-like domain-containing protein [Candidatus Cloacimonadota bacterium]
YVSLYVDDVMLEVIPTTDLACLSIAGNSTPSVGNGTTYTASIYNWGTNNQATYTVKLFNANNVELASAAGVSIGMNQTVQVPLQWTPTTPGAMQIYAKVMLTGDQNNLNDASSPLSLTVMPAGIIVSTIGTGTELGRIPMDMYYKNSLFQTIFYPQEIGAYGNITSIAFYSNFFSNLPNMPTKIWLGTTNLMDLTSGWIPATAMTQVFDGTVNYPNGVNTITIPLTQPFTYAGGNLVMMVNRPMDTQYYNFEDRFYFSNGTTQRSRNVWSDWDEYIPNTPPAEALASTAYPNTSLFMTPLSPDPIFTVTPQSRNFGTVLLNSTHNQSFSIMNAGGSPLTINSINIAGNQFFSLQNQPTLPATLNTGQSITFIARYNPSSVGNHAATVTINDNLRIALGSREAHSRTPHAVELSGICIDPTITSLPYLQNFDAVTAPEIPVQWSRIVQGTSTQSIISTAASSFSAPNSVMLNNAADLNSTLILVAPPYANTIATNTSRVNFRAMGGAGSSISVGIMTNPQDPESFTLIQNVDLNQDWTEYVVSFGGYTGTGKNIAFKHNQQTQYQAIYLDNVMLELIPQNDLAALAVIGNTTPSVGSPSNYTVSVFNWGSNVQSTYTVKLFRQGDVEIGSVNGITVNPNQTVNVVVPWTPATEGAASIYAKTVLTGDQNPLNDASPNLAVNVYPEGLVVLTIGEGNQTGRLPVDMYYMNSLFECMYYPAELGNTIGSITGIGFYNFFTEDLLNMPTNVWIGTTTQADLSSGWIPSTQLTQVFSGTVNYPSGENLIQIPFNQNYLYLNGQNLVLMVERPMDTDYYGSQNVFRTQTLTQSRAHNVYSDTIDFDPAAPPDAPVSAAFPKTSIFIIPGGVGHLNGTVTGAGNTPLAGVAIASTTGGYTATTNAQGQYSIINIVAGTYDFTFSRYGYVTQTVSIVIPEDETIVRNIALQQMLTVSVSGTIIASDTSSGLSGAGINLQGYEDYNVSSNASGAFSIPGVYANQTYDFTIIRPGYQNYSGTIEVGSTNYSFGTVTLNEVAYAPRQVLAEITQNNTQVSLTWLAPDPNALDVLESFEGDVFPPESWTQVINNTGAPVSGIDPTWCRFGSVNINAQLVNPTEGVMQAGLWWSYDHQDEWLITPSFNCPPAAYLNFDTYAFLGSNSGDHYYVKMSTDNGNTWNILWDASAQTGGWNYYASPITIDLSQYEGLQLKIAWHADDPVTNDGLWYAWFIDDIYIGNEVSAVRFAEVRPETQTQTSRTSRAVAPSITQFNQSALAPLQTSLSNSRAAFSAAGLQPVPAKVSRASGHPNRALIGYKVWRLFAGQEGNQNAWVDYNPTPIPSLNYIDLSWASLPNGSYRWAVKAIYTSGVTSVPAFSNIITKEEITGFISGVVRNSANNSPIPSATVTAGTHTATTNSVGAYSILIPIGSYNV